MVVHGADEGVCECCGAVKPVKVSEAPVEEFDPFFEIEDRVARRLQEGFPKQVERKG